jgi:hypothetical protein
VKVYVYTQQEVERALGGLQPTWQACPTTVDVVTNPSGAQAFFVPLEVGHIEVRHPQRINGVMPVLSRLPHWGSAERRHFFYMHSDEDAPIRTTAVVFRQSVNRHRKDPNTVAMPAPVDDFGYLAGADYDALPFHITFVGYIDDPRGIRRRAVDALAVCPRLNCFIDTVNKHWCHFEGTPQGDHRRKRFIDGLASSRLVLAPRGKGQHSYRLFEAMSAGRIPILIGDDYELPFQQFVNYNECIFRLDESRAHDVDNFVLGINELCRPTPCMAEKAYKARRAWVDYLARANWDRLTLEYLERML